MTIVVTTTSTTTAQDICTDALEILGAVGQDESPGNADIQTALRGLQTVLSELPLAGYDWPKLSAETALTWASVQTFTLPTDYYGNPVAWKTVNGAKCELTQIPHADWVQLANRQATGVATSFYVGPDNTFYVYPVPSTDPGLYVQYQRVIDDPSLATSPDVLRPMKSALSWGVADELSMKFQIPQQERVEIAQRWGVKKALMLQNAAPSGPISFEVSE